MTQEDFINIVSSGKKSDMISILQNKEISISIIENNLFWNNIDLIVEKFDQNMIMTIIKYLSSYDFNFLSYGLIKLFKYNFTTGFYIKLFEVVEQSNLDLVLIYNYILNNNMLNVSSYALFVSMYKQDKKEILFQNLDLILKNSYNLLKIKQLVSNDLKFIKKIDTIIENNKNNVVYDIIINSTGMTKEEINQEKIFDFVKNIIEQVLNNENKNYSDITYLGEGSSSVAYLIGDKVIKIGSERFPFKVDNNKRFLKPLLRTNINSLKNNEVLFCIEITEKVDTSNITEEDAYFIYKEFRDLGFVWDDAHPRNLGRLINKNKIYFNEAINPTKEAINYTTENDLELEKGDLVILDNEFIFEEEDFESKIGFENTSDLVKEFENRYQEEKKQKSY